MSREQVRQAVTAADPFLAELIDVAKGTGLSLVRLKAKGVDLGMDPPWLSWPMHTAAEMAKTEWKPNGKGKKSCSR